MRARLVVPLVAVAVLLTACVSFPEDGPVARGIEGAPEAEAISLVAEDPQPGDSPEQIVRGFLAGAAAGTTDDFTVARKYLTIATSSLWQPHAEVTIYAGSETPIVEEISEREVQVQVQVAGTVDADGVYTTAAPGTTTTFDFRVFEDDRGQWRISDLADGVLLSDVVFGSQYRQVPLYFLSQDASTLVPDTRWYPQRNAPTSAMQGLLAGPVPWLGEGVRSAIPTDTTLAFGAVTATDGVAQVDLTADVLDADTTARALLRAQIEQTLSALPQVQRVELTVDGGPFDTPAAAAPVQVDPSVGRWPTVVDTQENLLSIFSGSLNPLNDAVSLEGHDARHIALGYDDEPPVMLSGPDDLVTVPTAEAESMLLVHGTGLVGPSYDRHGWIWTGSGPNDGELLLAHPDGRTMELEVDALVDTDLIALRLSRDGARLVLIYEADAVLSVEVFAVVRDDAGTPEGIGEGNRLAPQLLSASDVVWVDEQTLAVLGTSGNSETVHMVTVGGRVDPLPAVVDAVAIASARGDRELYVVTEDGSLYGRSGLGWRLVAGGIAAPAFPG